MRPRRGHVFNKFLSVSVFISLLDKLMKEMIFNNLSDKTVSYFNRIISKNAKGKFNNHMKSPNSLAL